MNKSLSDDSDRILELQGVGWFTRKAIGLATLTLDVKHYKDDSGVEHIDVDQTLTGGIKGTSENRILDWGERNNSDHVFGDVISKSHRIDPDELSEAHLKNGWLPEVKTDGAIHTLARSDTEKSHRIWSAEQAWGFEEIDGVRRYARHVRFSHNNGEEIHEIKLYYDYVAV